MINEPSVDALIRKLGTEEEPVSSYAKKRDRGSHFIRSNGTHAKAALEKSGQRSTLALFYFKKEGAWEIAGAML